MSGKYKVGDRVLWRFKTLPSWQCTVVHTEIIGKTECLRVRVDKYNYSGPYAHDNLNYHSLFADDSMVSLIQDGTNATPVSQSSPSNTVVNDHVCPTCGNTRCSKTERSCWLCGNSL